MGLNSKQIISSVTIDGVEAHLVDGGIPEGYIKPKGEITITEQGTFNVKEYDKAVVTAPFDSKFAQLINGTLTEVTAEDLQGATKINYYAFYNQKNLRIADLPSNIDNIGRCAFFGCSNLKPFDTKQIKTLGFGAFNDYPMYNGDVFLQNAYLDTSSGTDGFFKNIAFRKLKIGGSLNKNLGNYLIRGSSTNLIALEIAEGTLTLPNSLIGSEPSILGTKGKVILPSTLVSMGAQALRNTGIKTIIIKTNNVLPIPAIDTVGGAVWQVTKEYFVVYEYIEDYKVATNWSALVDRLFPLVKSETDLATIDTTLYTKACVIGNDKGIEDDNNYAIYNHTNGEWVKES